MKISIITAVFNSCDTIADTLASVLEQTHADIEWIVIDGGSTDGTLDILHIHTDRIAVLVSEPDHGIYDALNKGLLRATGEVVGFLHADDVYADATVLENIAAAFSDRTVGAAYGDLVYVRRDAPRQVLRYWRAGEFVREKLKQGWMPPHPTFYARRSLYERLGGFDTGYRIAADYDCMLRFLQSGMAVHYIPRVLVRMRTGGASNRSLKSLLRKSYEDYRALKTNRVAGLWALVWKNLGKLPQWFVRPEG